LIASVNAPLTLLHDIHEQRAVRCATLRGVAKVIWQILKLLWKVFRVVIWKWLKPFLGKFAFGLIILIGIIVAIVVLSGGC
jgi:hypothetical protein